MTWTGFQAGRPEPFSYFQAAIPTKQPLGRKRTVSIMSINFQRILQHCRQTKDMERNGHFLQGWKTFSLQVPHSSKIHFTTSLFLKCPFSVLGRSSLDHAETKACEFQTMVTVLVTGSGNFINLLSKSYVTVAICSVQWAECKVISQNNLHGNKR